MSRVISVFNQKGGVGKTTTVINLSAALAYTGLIKKNVLVIDMDPQGNTSSGLGFNKAELDLDIYNVLIGQASINEAKKEVRNRHLQLVPAKPDLTGFEVEALSLEDPYNCLKKALDEVRDDYDYLFIDCPPSLGMLSLNALTASDSVLIPIQTEFYALEGVSQLVSTLDMIKESVNPNLEVEGVLLSMVDRRTNLAQDVEAEVKKYFGDQVFETVIPRNVRLAEAPSYGESIITYDRFSKGAQAYLSLAKEIKKKEKEEKKNG